MRRIACAIANAARTCVYLPRLSCPAPSCLEAAGFALALSKHQARAIAHTSAYIQPLRNAHSLFPRPPCTMCFSIAPSSTLAPPRSLCGVGNCRLQEVPAGRGLAHPCRCLVQSGSSRSESGGAPSRSAGPRHASSAEPRLFPCRAGSASFTLFNYYRMHKDDLGVGSWEIQHQPSTDNRSARTHDITVLLHARPRTGRPSFLLRSRRHSGRRASGPTPTPPHRTYLRSD